MTKNASVQVVTVDQVFPAGTVDTLYTYSLAKADGTVVSSNDSAEVSATFTGVDVGDYVITVTKNGVSASASFSVVADPDATLQVPSSITVSLA